MGQTVLILGGGVGGLVAANVLRAALPDEHRVVLVEREAAFVFAPSLLWLMTGDRTAAQISRPLARVEKKGIELVRGEIQKIDVDRREAVVDGRTVVGDYLVIALGAELASETKCPAAPYEAAMLLEHYCRKRKIRDKTVIDLFAAEPGPMGVAGPDVSKGVRQMVEAKEIGYHPEHQIVTVDPASRRLKFKNGVEASYDLLAYVPPHRAPQVVRESGLVGESGWIAVDRHTMATKHERVFAIGDVVGIPLALGKPLPKAGVFAHGEAEAVGHNIAREITGKGEPATFTGEGECFVETGGGKAGFGKGNFYGEPLPQVKLHPPGRRWHAGKVLFEKYWLRRWF